MRLLAALAAALFSLTAAAQEPGPDYKPLIDAYHQALEYTNKDFTGKDWKACKAMCEADRRCQAFTHYKPVNDGSRCILRPGIGAWHTTKAWSTISGVRKTPVPELTPEQKFAAAERAKRSMEEVVGLYAPRMKPNLAREERLMLEAHTGNLGDDYLEAFAARYPIEYDSSADRLCALGHASCREALAAKEARRAQQEAKYAADMAANSAQARAGAAAIAAALNASAFVDVRTYDRSGNFVGTRTMTKTQAEIIGATPD